MDNRYQEPEDLLLDESFKKWILGSDPAATQYWEAWLLAHPEKETLVMEAQKLLSLINFESRHLPEEDSQRILDSIMSRPRPALGMPKVVAFTHSWYKVAAVLAMVIMVGLACFFISNKNRTLLYATDFGQIKTITLPDSSKVVLNANSKLRVGSGQEVREVWLEGEGFFSVRKKAKRERSGYTKFIVHTQNLTVEVLGTEFNVKDRPTDKRVVLSSGKIKLDIVQGTSSLIMQPGESVRMVGSGKTIVREQIDPQTFTSWVNQRLTLRGTSVHEIAVILRDLYGYEVRFVNKSIEGKVLSGTLPTNDPDALLDALSTLLNVEVSRKGKEVVIGRENYQK